MGKPFKAELDAFQEVYAWAMTAPLGVMANNIRASRHLPLIAVGSGGSFSAAQHLAGLHAYACGVLAYAATPMQMAHDLEQVSKVAVHILSAGGSNVDVLAAVDRATDAEPQVLLLTTAVRGSRAAAMLPPMAGLTEFEVPTGRDGFLATNSLLAFATLFTRAYHLVANQTISPLPARMDELLGQDPSAIRRRLATETAALWTRDTMLVLYCPATRAAAFDLESKFSEAALGNVLLSDLRNFAHGRHHWLAKRPASTCVLALADGPNEALARRTLAAVPSDTPRTVCITQGDYAVSAVAALITSMFLAEAAGNARTIDPGRPGVPSFGRRIYHLRPTKVRQPVAVATQVAVQRKTGHTWAHLVRTGASGDWQNAHEQFVRKLAAARFGAIVLDYDGTMCDAKSRFGGMDRSVAALLNGILKQGPVVGIATGRGKSVRTAIQDLIEEELWPRLWIGYYNCSDIGRADDDARPAVEPIDADLQNVYERICSDPVMTRVQLTLRPAQLTLETPDLDSPALWDRLALNVRGTNVRVVSSSHSIDVLLGSVTKLALVEHLRSKLPSPLEVLCIGDRGQWPGNDHDLLSTPYSLSADDVSPDPSSCWNLAPAGVRGPAATCYYLDLLRKSGAALRFRAVDLRHA